jgi:competence protein ComEC
VFGACDVGQGDALLLAAGPGAAVEIDAGPDPVLIDRCLRDFGINRVPLLVLTHFHLDHVAGLVGVSRGRTVDRLLTGPLDDPLTGSLIVHRFAAAHRLAVQAPPVGTHLDVGEVHLDVLGPESSMRGTRSDPNNSSLVLRAVVNGIRIMLPGDAEIESQRRLLTSGADLRADVLKVPHHGSAYSDPEFLGAVHADVAVVSVGLHNDYGHPSPVLLTEMARLGVPLLRTDRDGDVAVAGSPGHMTTVVHGVAASTVASPRVGASVDGARMAPCRRDRSASMICRSRCLRWSCSSATRNSWSIGRSARSPPPRDAPTRRWSRPNWPAASSTVRSCTNCSVRRCSATGAC